MALLTTYLVYIKECLGKHDSGVNEAEVVSLLQGSVALLTKHHGRLQPSKDVLHFSSEFQPDYDLEQLFPGKKICMQSLYIKCILVVHGACIEYIIYIIAGVKWKLVSPRYLKNVTSKNAVTKWRTFLLKVGVQNVLAVRQFNDQIPKVSFSTASINC